MYRQLLHGIGSISTVIFALIHGWARAVPSLKHADVIVFDECDAVFGRIRSGSNVGEDGFAEPNLFTHFVATT